MQEQLLGRTNVAGAWASRKVLDEGPVDPRPDERVRHGWRTPGFRAKQDSAAMKAQERPCGLQ